MKKRESKDSFVQKMADIFLNNDFLILVNFKSVNASESLTLRNSLKAVACGILVVKNTLARLALKKADKFPLLLDKFSGSVAIVYSSNVAEAAKQMVNFINANEKKMSIICAAHLNEILTVEDVNKLAMLPTLSELRIKIMQLISRDIVATLALCVNSSFIRLIRVLGGMLSPKK